MGKAPSGILKVFLVLPEGEENFIRSPVGDLKSFIAWAMVVVVVVVVWSRFRKEGLRKKNFKTFFRCFKKFHSSQRWGRWAAE